VTEPEQLLPRGITLLTTVLAMAPVAVRNVIQVIDAGYDLPLPEALHLEALKFGLTCATKDKREGVAAFLEKRQPDFTGE
jgi:enoyl-CoA hydratase